MWPFKFNNHKKNEENEKWSRLHIILRNSFSLIKKDIENMNYIFNRKESEQDKSLEELHTKMALVESILTEVQEKQNSLQEIQQISQNQVKNMIVQERLNELKNPSTETVSLIEHLTDTQKSLLIKLNILLQESGEEWISMKYLTQELYPNKNYEDVKSMVSNYTDTLLNLGLLEKKRKGRQIYLLLTNKTKKILPQKNLKIKIKNTKQ